MTEVAPFALVRVAALAHPAPARTEFRALLAALVAVESTVGTLAGPLSDALYSSAAGHSVDFHRRVVLPLRRAVYNGRPWSGDLPARVPGLASWLAAQASLSSLAASVFELWPSALAAARTSLSLLCQAEPLRRAAVLTGRDLLHGIDRVASGSADRRARKAEATVLRYALRASSKTSPFSWYTYVGWGYWSTSGSPVRTAPSHHRVIHSPPQPLPFRATPDRLAAGPSPGEGGGNAGDDLGLVVGVSRVNSVLVARLTAALLAARRDSVPHRLAPGLREVAGRLVFRRDIPVEGATRAYLTKEEVVDIPATAPLRFVVDAVGPKGATPAELVSALATKLPGDQAQAAAKYVTKLMDIGVLIPVAPVDPQDPDALTALAGWAQEPDLAEIAQRTKEFANLAANDRVTRLAELEEVWARKGFPGIQPVVEDVVLPKAVRLNRQGIDTLAKLTPLVVLFDRQLRIRRIARDKFVARFGVGGSARPADTAELLSESLVEALTSETSAEIREIHAMCAGEVTDEMITRASELLTPPKRPVSYSWFVQRNESGDLVVNHCYAGFARFASRFLDHLPHAKADVEKYLTTIFPHGFTQYRPVGGFTANLHPKLAEEVGEEPNWADFTPDDLVAHHDPATDEVRLTYHGRPLDVLYLGFLMPIMLPDRVTALYTDLSCGWADFDTLRSTVDHGGVVERGRLRYRDVILARRSWEFATPPEFPESEAGIAIRMAKLRAKHNLPEHVFVSAGGGIESMADFEERLNAAKPQYVDLGDALHLRCLPKLLTRYPGVLKLTEALPVPSGRTVELIAETWWRAP